MKLLFGIVLALGVLVFLLRRFGQEGSQAANVRDKSENGDKKAVADCRKSSCGVTCFCDDVTLRRAVTTEIEYFDDEELDDYRGIGADQYTEAQVEDFNEVLTTLKPSEVGDWMRSLELRGIALPSALKDEALMIMEDGNKNTTSHT